MQIREIEEKDNQAIETIVKRSLESAGLNLPGTAYYDPQLGSLAQFYQQTDRAKYWVLVDDRDNVMGGAGIGPYAPEKRICELQKLYLKPEARGQGLSKKLMETALEFAEKHYDFCYIETFKELETANSLYGKYGFQPLESRLEGSEHSACDTWYLKKMHKES